MSNFGVNDAISNNNNDLTTQLRNHSTRTALDAIHKLLEKEIGLSAESVGADMISKAVRLRMKDCGLARAEDYVECLRSSENERAKLIEEVVIPETWFFRNQDSFTYLRQFVKNEWIPANRGKTLRVLSAPCSTGEEPYSIAMSLLDAGIDRSKAEIEAVDISTAAVLNAKTAAYGPRSFRGDNLSFRDRFFDLEGALYVLKDSVKNMVTFRTDNLLRKGFVKEREPCHIIFCRNLLIYLSPKAKKEVLAVIRELLANDGILFLGHAERGIALEEGFAGIQRPGVFACRKERRKGPCEAKNNANATPLPKQRIFETAAQTNALENAGSVFFSIDAAAKNAVRIETAKDAPCEGQMDLFDGAQQLADQGSLQAALALCSDFLKQNPAHASAHFLMGLLFEALDDAESAESCFNKTLYLEPKHSDAMSHLAFIMEQKGEKERALSLRRRAMKVYGGV